MVAPVTVTPGERFGRFTVIEEVARHVSPNGQPQRRVFARCDCGAEVVVLFASLRSGKSKSCGCAKREASRARATKHGQRRTGLYYCWCNMKQRSSGKYPRPAYNGVGRDPRWDDFVTFAADMGPTYFEGAVLARYGDQGDYGPTNCRWLTVSENSAERRKR